jgi:hypothetical protein
LWKMAHPTPEYSVDSVPDHLCDGIMVEFPFSSLFSGASTKRDLTQRNDVMDSITFTPTTSGPRTPRSMEEIQCIINHFYSVLDDLSLMDRFSREVEKEKERPMELGLGNMDRGTPEVKLQDAVKITAKVIQYWDEEWIPESSQANREFATMEKAATLIADLLEAVEDQFTITWDDLGKLSLYRARLWLQSGGFDKAARFNECEELETATEDRSNTTKSTSYLEEAQNIFQCNLCADSFDRVSRLQKHLRQDHDKSNKQEAEESATQRIHEESASRMRQRNVPGVERSPGKTLRQRARESLNQPGAEIGGNREGSGTAPKSGDKDIKYASILGEGWLEVSPIPYTPIQAAQCNICSKMYASSEALRNHYRAEHERSADTRELVDSLVFNVGQNAEEEPGKKYGA